MTDKEKEEVTVIIASDINDFIDMSGEIKFGEKEKIVKMVDAGIDNIEKKGTVEFTEAY
ncbi:hypothetical protein [Enterococcus hulanensis]|uniref:hypothetical protein n=1 Tax=Enterococcus hulanensis TaxID=2559929 RepID=UPI0020181D84|nr:hypothetical protein [Enterococcus hulanensis]